MDRVFSSLLRVRRPRPSFFPCVSPSSKPVRRRPLSSSSTPPSSSSPSSSSSSSSAAAPPADALSSSRAHARPPPLAFMSGLYHQYVLRLKTHPILTKSITAFIIGGAADTVAQLGGHSHGDNDTKKSPMSFRRILSFATCSAVITAPMYHYAYIWLERMTTSIPKMVFIDSLCLTPVWYVMYIPLVTLLSKGAVNSAATNNTNATATTQKKSNSQLVSAAMVSNAKPVATLTVTALPPLEAINFMYVPLHLRVPFMCCVDFVFTAAVSLIANRNHQRQSAAATTTATAAASPSPKTNASSNHSNEKVE